MNHDQMKKEGGMVLLQKKAFMRIHVQKKDFRSKNVAVFFSKYYFREDFITFDREYRNTVNKSVFLNV